MGKVELAGPTPGPRPLLGMGGPKGRERGGGCTGQNRLNQVPLFAHCNYVCACVHGLSPDGNDTLVGASQVPLASSKTSIQKLQCGKGDWWRVIKLIFLKD